MVNDAPRGFAVRGTYMPLRSRGAHEHGTRRRPCTLTERTVRRRSIAAAGALSAVPRTVQIGLFDPNARPVGVQLFGDHHRERRFDPLTHVRVFGPDRHRSVRIDTDVAVR